MEDKGIYNITTCTDAYFETNDVIAFNKRYFTKEQAVHKFKEMFPNAKIIKEYESYVRFLWWTYYSGYEYIEVDTRCGFRLVDKGGKGSSNCWIIERELCREYDGILI